MYIVNVSGAEIEESKVSIRIHGTMGINPSISKVTFSRQIS